MHVLLRDVLVPLADSLAAAAGFFAVFGAAFFAAEAGLEVGAFLALVAEAFTAGCTWTPSDMLQGHSNA